MSEEEGWIKLYLDISAHYFDSSGGCEEYKRGIINQGIKEKYVWDKTNNTGYSYLSIWRPKNFFDLYRLLNIIFKASHKIRLSIEHDESSFIMALKFYMGKFNSGVTTDISFDDVAKPGPVNIKSFILDCELNVAFVASHNIRSLGSKSLSSLAICRRESFLLRQNNELNKSFKLFILDVIGRPFTTFDEEGFFDNLRNSFSNDGGEFWLNEFISRAYKKLNRTTRPKPLLTQKEIENINSAKENSVCELNCTTACRIFYFDCFISLCQAFYEKQLSEFPGIFYINELGRKFFSSSSSMTPDAFMEMMFCNFIGKQSRDYVTIKNSDWKNEGKPLIFMIILRLLICNLSYAQYDESSARSLHNVLFKMPLYTYYYQLRRIQSLHKFGLMVSSIAFFNCIITILFSLGKLLF